MTKPQKSNKEGKKKAQMTLMEKRAAKKTKNSGKDFLGNSKVVQKPASRP